MSLAAPSNRPSKHREIDQRSAAQRGTHRRHQRDLADSSVFLAARVRSRVLRGWEVGGIVKANSGVPTTPTPRTG
jgi:hypothetical protein